MKVAEILALGCVATLATVAIVAGLAVFVVTLAHAMFGG
jgi:hypothetical protein